MIRRGQRILMGKFNQIKPVFSFLREKELSKRFGGQAYFHL